jgi:glycosidase
MRPRLFVLFFLALFCSCSKKEAPAATTPTPSTPAPATAADISSLNCSGSTISGSATVGIAYSGTVTMPYLGGNGLAYNAGSALTSSGVTGLTATLQAGTLASGSGSFTFSVTGTPSATGLATFSLAFGSRSCSVSIPVNEDPNFTQYGTPFTAVPNRQDAVIYQVNMRAFSAQSNFQGVIARLDSIKALGANVVYLMPIYPVGTVNSVNSPYSVRDYRAINTEFGTLTDLRALVDGAHSRNMSVMLDWVANHTAWDHPWISTHSDWYVKNSSGAIISPPGTGWNDVAQLDYTNSAMRLEMIRSLKYWVYTANVDGFRFDYADGPPATFWRQAIDTLRAISTHNLLLLAEGSRSDHFSSGFDFTFGFNYYGSLKSVFQSSQPVTVLDARNTSEFTGATNGQTVVRYLTNHDVNGSDGTPLDLFGGLPGSMAAFVVTAYMKGVPMIYNGQEVGTPFRLTFPFTGADINWTLNPSVTADYKRVIAFRNSSAAIRRGTLTSYNSANVAAFTKELGTEKVFVLSNLRNSSQSFTLPAALANTTWINAFTGTSVTLSTAVSLGAYEYLVLKNQ